MTLSNENSCIQATKVLSGIHSALNLRGKVIKPYCSPQRKEGKAGLGDVTSSVPSEGTAAFFVFFTKCLSLWGYSWLSENFTYGGFAFRVTSGGLHGSPPCEIEKIVLFLCGFFLMKTLIFRFSQLDLVWMTPVLLATRRASSSGAGGPTPSLHRA